MAGFPKKSLDPGLFSPDPSALPTGTLSPCNIIVVNLSFRATIVTLLTLLIKLCEDRANRQTITAKRKINI